jgi:hypothetical protein
MGYSRALDAARPPPNPATMQLTSLRAQARLRNSFGLEAQESRLANQS